MVVVGVRVRDRGVAVGAIRRICMMCGEETWVVLAAAGTVREPSFIVCTKCWGMDAPREETRLRAERDLLHEALTLGRTSR